jgi:protein-tyrosine-phosphatase
MSKIRNVLFICFGNTARSPAAQFIAEWLKLTKYEEELKDVTFDSAGFFSYYKTPRPDTLAYIREKAGTMLDHKIEHFQGKVMTDDLLEKQDLILAMESRHTNKFKRKFKHLPEVQKKAYLLLEFAGEESNIEIPDPINLPPEEYHEIMQRVHLGVEKTLEKVIKINQSL